MNNACLSHGGKWVKLKGLFLELYLEDPHENVQNTQGTC